jgi:UDP:flavonoid glycosyltransferase YjiC (YdhE family)
MVPIARALADAGHEPIFATTASFRPNVARAGFASVAAGADWLAAEVDRKFPDLFTGRSTAAGMSGALATVFGRTARHLVPDLRRLLTSMRADVLLGESTEWAGPLAAEVVGVPHALVGIGPLHPLPVLAGALGKYWQFARKNLGLPDDPHLQRLCPYLYLDPYPTSMQPQPIRNMLSVAHPIRPVPYQVGDTTPPPWLARLPDRPTVYVSMGTLFNRVAGPYETVIDALRDEALNVIVMLGPNRDPGDFGALPEHIRIERYIPQSVLMPRTDLVVTHGGYNTVVAALSSGIPMLCLPMGADQPYTAFRIAAAGAGLNLGSENAGPDEVRRAVRALLGDDLFRRNAERLGAEISAMPAAGTAVEHLAKLAATPVTAVTPAAWPLRAGPPALDQAR